MSFTQKLFDANWKNVAKGDARRLAGQVRKSGIDCVCDLVYKDSGNIYHRLDICFPEGTRSPLPTIFLIHGGGWMYGDKELYKNYSFDLASRGFTVITLNYRLVPEVHVDGQLRDIFRALQWVEKHAADYHIDLSRFFAVGDSAGGHLVCLTSVMNNSEALRAELQLRDNNIDIKAVGCICGVPDLTAFLGKYPVVSEYGRALLGDDFKTSRLSKIVSLPDIIGEADRMPAFFVTSSKQDPFFSQAKALDALLTDRNIPHKVRLWNKGREHTLGHVFCVLFPEWRESIITNDDMCNFFLSRLK